MEEGTLSNVIDSCVKYWIGVIRDDGEREELFDLYEELLKQDKGEAEEETDDYDEKYKSIMSGASTSSSVKKTVKGKVGITVANSANQQDKDEFSDDDGGTLEYAMSLIDSDNEANKESKSDGKRTGKAHEMSDSDNDVEMQSQGVDESQEMSYWSNDAGKHDNDKFASDEVGIDEVIDNNGDMDSKPDSDKKAENIEDISGATDEDSNKASTREEASVVETPESKENDKGS